VEARFPLLPALEVSTGLIVSTAMVTQELAGVAIDYQESSFAVPLLAHALVPAGRGTVGVLLGPAITVLPAPATRTVRTTASGLTAGSASMRAGVPVQATMEAGLEWGLEYTTRRRVVIGLRFVHPLTSPRYPWVSASAGNTRINRFDLNVSLLYRARSDEAQRAAPQRSVLPAATRATAAPRGDRARLGVEAYAGTAIGTGKGHWDWYDGGAVQRIPTVAGSVGVRGVVPVRPHLALGAGIRYAWNPTRITTSGGAADYRHDSIESSLTAELRVPFEGRERATVGAVAVSAVNARGASGGWHMVVWGGPALVVLPGSARTAPAGVFDLASGDPGNRVHAGVDLGLGVDNGRYRFGFRYVTLYTAPNYPRTDGAPASDIRWHRFETGITWYVPHSDHR
jgi:hypothetical protein